MATIRPGTDGDLPELRVIQTAALAEPWPELLDLAAGAGGPRLRVVDDGGPVGYVVAVTAGHPKAYVPEIAVHPDRQGEGMGAQLLEGLLAELASEGFAHVRLTARVEDDGVVDFYRDLGFQPVERVTGHFETGDGLVLERHLRS